MLLPLGLVHRLAENTMLVWDSRLSQVNRDMRFAGPLSAEISRPVSDDSWFNGPWNAGDHQSTVASRTIAGPRHFEPTKHASAVHGTDEYPGAVEDFVVLAESSSATEEDS